MNKPQQPNENGMSFVVMDTDPLLEVLAGCVSVILHCRSYLWQNVSKSSAFSAILGVEYRDTWETTTEATLSFPQQMVAKVHLKNKNKTGDTSLTANDMRYYERVLESDCLPLRVAESCGSGESILTGRGSCCVLARRVIEWSTPIWSWDVSELTSLESGQLASLRSHWATGLRLSDAHS